MFSRIFKVAKLTLWFDEFFRLFHPNTQCDQTSFSERGTSVLLIHQNTKFFGSLFDVRTCQVTLESWYDLVTYFAVKYQVVFLGGGSEKNHFHAPFFFTLAMIFPHNFWRGDTFFLIFKALFFTEPLRWSPLLNLMGLQTIHQTAAGSPVLTETWKIPRSTYVLNFYPPKSCVRILISI